MNVSEIIDALGGPTVVSKALHLPPTTVGNWRLRGSIPAKWHGALLKVGGGSITAEQLVQAHEKECGADEAAA